MAPPRVLDIFTAPESGPVETGPTRPVATALPGLFSLLVPANAEFALLPFSLAYASAAPFFSHICEHAINSTDLWN